MPGTNPGMTAVGPGADRVSHNFDVARRMLGMAAINGADLTATTCTVP